MAVSTVGIGYTIFQFRFTGIETPVSILIDPHRFILDPIGLVAVLLRYLTWFSFKEDDDDGMASDPEAKLCHYVKASIQPPLSPALYPVS